MAFDQRCCGRSDKDFNDVTVGANGADVEALVEHLGLERPVINGWSFGGAVATEAAARLGDRLGGLVLVGPPTPRYTQADDYPHGGTAEIMEQTLTALRDTRPDFLKALSQGVCHAEVSEHAIDWMWAAFMETSPRADDSLRDLGVVDQRELLPTIQAPALVCSGDHDAVVDPAIARVAAELLPNARLVHFEGSGHAPTSRSASGSTAS